MKNPPLKRHVALIPFSHDHNVGLYHAKRLRMASGLGEHLDPGTAELAASDQEGERLGKWGSVASAQQAWTGFWEVWQGEIAHHFDDEERELIPLVNDQAIIDRLVAEHVQIRKLVARAAAANNSGLAEHDLQILGELGMALTHHIRWEERTLFPHVQNHTDEARLEQLRKATATMENNRPASKARGSAGTH